MLKKSRSFLFLIILLSVQIFAETSSTINNDLLSNYGNALELIATKLDTPLNDQNINKYQNEITEIDNRINNIKSHAEDKLVNQYALLKNFGPAPQKDEAPEDASIAKQRKQIQESITKNEGKIKHANVILQRSAELQNILASQKMKRKACELFQRKNALYLLPLWPLAEENQNFWLQFKNDIAFSKTQLNNQTAAHLLAYKILATVCILFLLSLAISFFLIYRLAAWRLDTQPSHFKKMVTCVIRITAFSVIPLTALGLFIGYLNNQGLLIGKLWSLSLLLYLAFGLILFFLITVRTLLAKSMTNWRLLHIQESSIGRLQTLLSLFIFFSILSWLIIELNVLLSFPMNAYLWINFVFRTLACLTGILALQKTNWLGSIKYDSNGNSPQTTRQTHHLFTIYIKYAAIIIFFTNPLLILIGYTSLSNVLFINFLETLVIVLTLLAAHSILHTVLARLLDVKGSGRKSLASYFHLTQHGRRYVHYWLLVFIDIVFIIFGIVAVLITWGIDKNYIWRISSPLILGFQIGSHQISLVTFLTGIIVLIVFFSLTRMIQTFLQNRVFPHTSLDLGAQHAIRQGFGYIGVIIAIILSLTAMGVNLTNLAIIAGALSVGIGFGLQNIVSNFISGIIMLIERPIKVGDRIIVGTDEGFVKRISVRATEIEKGDRSTVLIPNSELISGRLQNWTFRSPLNRIDIKIGVAYGTDLKKTEKILLDIANQHPDLIKDPEPWVCCTEFADSAITLTLYVFTNVIDRRTRIASQLRFSIEQAFRQEDIEMPYPQRVVQIKNQ